MPAAAERLVSARPDILVDGQRHGALAAGLTSLLIEETSAGLYRCEAVFGNWGPVGERVDFLYFDRALLDFGKPFAVQLDGATLFSGRIGALEGRFPPSSPPEIAVLAEDRLQDLRMTRRSRSFQDKSDADVMRQIAQEHGLDADVDIQGGSHRVLAQVNQSDLAFLRGRARAAGVELWVEDTRLSARPRPDRAGTPLTLRWGGRLRGFTVLADLAHQATGLTVGGWDVAAKQAITASADLAVVAAELDGGRSGGDLLRQALGERRASLAHATPASEEEARALAQSWLQGLARRFVVGRGSAETDPALKVGAAVRLEGLGELFSGQYAVSEVRHRFNESQGLWSEFTAERVALGGSASGGNP